MDAWWVPLLQQDVSRERSRAVSEAKYSPMAAYHDPASSRGNADTLFLRAQSLQADTVFVQTGSQSLFQVSFPVLSFTATLIAGC